MPFPYLVGPFSDIPINALNVKFIHLQMPERRSEMPVDNIAVVLRPTFLRGAVCHPIVEQIRKLLLWWTRRTKAPADFLGFVFLLPKVKLRVLEVVEHGALPVAMLVEPSNTPLAVMFDRSCHAALFSAARCLKSPEPIFKKRFRKPFAAICGPNVARTKKKVTTKMG